MTSPAFNDLFNPFYDLYSINEKDLTIPAHFDNFLPDNQEDYNCTMVISPSISKGVSRWTKDGKWITIGIYRDEGRAPAQRPIITNLSWTRNSNILTIINPAGHKLHVGDKINLYNVSVWNRNNVDLPNITVKNVIDPFTFEVYDDRTSILIDGQTMYDAMLLFVTNNVPLIGQIFGVFGQETGDTSGNAASYQENFITNFYETYRVFRLLPSFKLVPYSEIQDIFTTTAPPQEATRRTLYDISIQQEVNIPGIKTTSINYELPTQSLPRDESINLQRRFSQVFDETGQPLKLTYNALGFPAQINNVDSKFKNDQIFYNAPVNQLGDPYIYIYDYYSLEINDASRGPYFSTSNIVRNLTVSGNINNLTNNISGLYNSTMNDAYGNLAIGAQQNNALVIRKQILPIALDAYNRPMKNPIS